MAIDHYDIIVPAYIESGTPFEVQVIAKDAGGAVVDDDTTSVTLSSTASDIQFDSSGNGIFGEVGDDIDTLLDGLINLFSLDTKGTSFTLTATATGGISGEDVVSYNFNCIVFASEGVVQSELSTLEHQKFLRRTTTVAPLFQGGNAENTLVSTEDLADTGLSVIV